MKSGSPAFGTPEYVKASFGAGTAGALPGLPWRSSNATASNVVDAQAAYEAQMSLWGALLGGCNFILHAAGWMESGLSTSYEKFILDVEMLQMFAEVFQPVGATSADLGVDAVGEVGPGGHFFGCAHTMERYRTAFYAPMASDWRNFGAWTDDGAQHRDPARQHDLAREARMNSSRRRAIRRSSRRSTPTSRGARRGRRAARHLRSCLHEGQIMRTHARVAVIGGGVVGASVLYHLTKAGWTDVLLIERAELTSGSTWHAAGGMHTLNGDPNVAKLQQYTIQLYSEIEKISGQSCGMHITGGAMLAGTRERMDWLKMAQARGRYLGMELELLSAAEMKKICPADGREVLRRRPVRPDRGPCRSLRRHARLRQGGADRRRGNHAPDTRDRHEATADGSWDVITNTAPCTPSTSSMPAACGRARSAAWSGSSCRCWRWSTST
jgi:hypothetical protein